MIPFNPDQQFNPYEVLQVEKNQALPVIKYELRNFILNNAKIQPQTLLSFHIISSEKLTQRIPPYFNQDESESFSCSDPSHPVILTLIGDYKQLSQLIQNDKSICLTTSFLNETLLYLACISGSLNIVKLLLLYGCNINAVSCGETPLHAAAYFGYEDIISYLVQCGASTSTKNLNGMLPQDEVPFPLIKNIISSCASDPVASLLQKLQDKSPVLNIETVYYQNELVAFKLRKVVENRDYFDEKWVKCFYGTTKVSIVNMFLNGLKGNSVSKEMVRIEVIEGKIPVGFRHNSKDIWDSAMRVSVSLYSASTNRDAKKIASSSDEVWCLITQLACKPQRSSDELDFRIESEKEETIYGASNFPIYSKAKPGTKAIVMGVIIVKETFIKEGRDFVDDYIQSQNVKRDELVLTDEARKQRTKKDKPGLMNPEATKQKSNKEKKVLSETPKKTFTQDRKLINAIAADIAKMLELISKEVIETVGKFNPDVDPNIIKKVQIRIMNRTKQGVLWQNMSKKARNFSQLSVPDQEQLLKNQLMMNPSIIQDTNYLDPISFDEIQETETLLSTSEFSFEPNNPNAIFHVLKAVSYERELEFVVRNKNHPPISKDSTNKLIDFALTNEIITEDSLFLLESERPEHCFKGFTLTLDEDYGIYQNDYDKKKEFAKTTKEKIASAFRVASSHVIIFSFGSGSGSVNVNVNFTVQNYDYQIIVNIVLNLRQGFPNFVDLQMHPSFFMMEISASSFDPRWNRDYRIESNCPYNEKRGNFDYFPPKGFVRYGLKVSGKFDDGNETWLGMSNVPGEWAVAYHGTAYSKVKKILESSLQSGPNNHYGIGIYCTPKIEDAAFYAWEKFTLKLQNGKESSFQYVLMCRVNVNQVHHCEVYDECPDALSNNYTVHMTTRENYWFANLNNTHQEHIRCYGVLVREV